MWSASRLAGGVKQSVDIRATYECAATYSGRSDAAGFDHAMDRRLRKPNIMSGFRDGESTREFVKGLASLGR
jgi:hypothetical protein